MLNVLRLMVSENVLDIQLPIQAPMMIGQSQRGSTSSMIHPARGIEMRAIVTRERFWGQMRHATMPIQMDTI